MTLALTTIIEMSKGTSRLIDIRVLDENGDAFDMTGGRAVFWVGKSPNSTGDDIVIEKNNPAIVLNTENIWVVEITINPEDTEDLPARCSYFFECRAWDQSNNEYVIATGLFSVQPSLTISAA